MVTYYFYLFLLKTFSVKPFQGQYPKIAVRINIAPINPATQRTTPSMEKAKTINMIPMITRKSASILPTFFVLTRGSIFLSLYCPGLNSKSSHSILYPTR
jgi:hypothetical protein